MLQWIDSHAHLSEAQMWPDIDEIAQRAQQAGITHIVNICTDADTLTKGLELTTTYPWIHHTAATTPHDVAKEGEALFPLMQQHALRGDLVAIGETGLDYHYEHSPRDIQKYFLKKYLHLALECGLPVVIHCREAFADLFEIVDAEYRKEGAVAPGILHCFTGSVEEAKEVVKRGWYLSLSGIVTFKKSEELKRVAHFVPLDQLLIETDAPFLAPQSKRGKRNEPSYLPEIGAMISQIKEISLEELSQATVKNAQKVFNL